MLFQAVNYAIFSQEEYDFLLHLSQQSSTNTAIAEPRLSDCPIPLRNDTENFGELTEFDPATTYNDHITVNELAVSYYFPN